MDNMSTEWLDNYVSSEFARLKAERSRYFKVIVAGSRSFSNYAVAREAISNFLSIENKEGNEVVILCGGAVGADMLGARYAQENNLKVHMFIPEWKRFGKQAGPIRNQNMVNDADAAIFFWDGSSKGTMDCINKANKAGLRYMTVLS